MEQQINELKQLRAELSHWQEQKYYDDQARHEAMMEGRRYNEKTTQMIDSKTKEASAALATFELWNYDVVIALAEMEATEAKARTEAAIKSAWNN
jgi:hypothetical protein